MNTKENKMGTMPVGRLLINMSFPIMVSMLIQALYNIVDSIFVAQISEKALSAVSLAFPVQNLIIGIAVGTGVGVNSLLSRSLGQGDFEKAHNVADHAIVLGVFSYSLFLIFGMFFTRSYFMSLTNDMEIINYGTVYLRIITIGSLGVFMEIVFERLLQSTGRTFHSMITQGIGAIINIILDPILIFGLLGAPKMGVAGAAVATIIGQVVAGIFGMIFNHRINKEISVNLKHFKFKWNIVKEIYIVGIPSIIMQSITSLTTYGINNILIRFSSTATAIYGVYFKLQSFVFMPVFGLNNGMVPIIAYNYGAEKGERIKRTIKLSMLLAASIMIFGLVTIQLFPKQILNLFNASEGMLSIGIPALRIISISYIFAGINIVASSVYQAFGSGMFSLMTAVLRQLVILLPAAYALSLFDNVNLIWWSYPISEGIALILSTILLKHVYDKKIIMIPDVL